MLLIGLYDLTGAVADGWFDQECTVATAAYEKGVPDLSAPLVQQHVSPA